MQVIIVHTNNNNNNSFIDLFVHYFGTGSHYVSLVGLELANIDQVGPAPMEIHLPLSLKCLC